MNIRREITLSPATWQALRLIADAHSGQKENESILLVDEVADRLLLRAIQDDYPQIARYQKKTEKSEEKLLESLVFPELK